MRLILAFLILGLGTHAQALPPKDAPVTIAVTPGYHWHQHTGDLGRLYLYWQGRQVGGYDKAIQIYRPLLSFVNDTWGQSCTPPSPLPVGFILRVANYGVDHDKISKEPRYRLNDREVAKADAYKLVESGLEDDSQKWRLTVIGPEADRQRFLRDFAASTEIASLREQMIVRDYEPTHWHVREAGFVVNGRPTIYLQAPDGKVLHRQDDYRGSDDLQALLGATGRASDAQAIRKPDDSYQPAYDPDLRRRLLGTHDLPWPTLALSLLVIVLGAVSLIRSFHHPHSKGNAS